MMRNEQAREFTPITQEEAAQLSKDKESAKLVFRVGELLTIKGRSMRVVDITRRSLQLTPDGW